MHLGNEYTWENIAILQLKWNEIRFLSFRQYWSLYRITSIFLLHIRLVDERDELPRLLNFDRSLFNKASRFWKHLNGLTCRCYKEHISNWYQCYNSSACFVISKIFYMLENKKLTIYFNTNSIKFSIQPSFTQFWTNICWYVRERE